MIFKHINISDIDNELNEIKKNKNENNFLIGLEVTHPTFYNLFDLNVDPQHTTMTIKDKKNKVTCLEKIKEILPIIKKNINKNIIIYFLKTDLDSVSAAVLIDLFINNYTLKSVIKQRINAIASYDRHGRDWIKKSTKTIIPPGLFVLVSGWKTPISQKVETVKKWILTGKFKNIEKFNKIADKNFKETLTTIKKELIVPKKVVFIKSTKRGACGIGYQHAPIVIALNPSYRFGFDDTRIYGKKWIIAQYDEGFINMNILLDELASLEEGWGGSSVILGSPQDKPSKITKQKIIELIKKILI